jgi:aryl-alcohol dehydrogenase-like predicted oxidoreductase
MELALGTVQFGLAYGIAGRGYAVPEKEARSILEFAWSNGLRTLDTAAAYGDIEQRLGHLCNGMAFRIISKVPSIPLDLNDAQAVKWVIAQATKSRQRLGVNLEGLMLHDSKDLYGDRGQKIWQELSAWSKDESVALGVSCYSPKDYLNLHKLFGITLVQLPGNGLDQRIAADIPVQCPGVEIHLRSAFLQGLLLLPIDQAKRKLPQAASALNRWHAWCKEKSLSPLEAAISAVKSFSAVSKVVVGVESTRQFEEVSQAWGRASPLNPVELAVNSLEIIDPRQWKASV